MVRLNYRSLALVLIAGSLAACSSGGADQAKKESGPKASSADIEQAAAGLDQVYGGKSEGVPGEATTRTPAPRKPNAPARAAVSEPTADPDADVQASLPATGAKPNSGGFRPSPPSRNTPTRIGAADYTPDRKARLIDELADVISAEPLTQSSTFGRAAELTVLGTLEPRAADPRLTDLHTRLSPAQRETLSAVREVFASIPAQRDGDATAIADLFRKAAERLDSTRGAVAPASLDVPTVALCRRVESFGKFTPLTSGALVAGKASAAYLYVEVENFTHRITGTDQATGADQYQVEIGQEIEVRSSDGTLVLHVPEQVAKDVTTRKRRDFYVFQRLDFPATLSLGAYSIKAIVRDRINGATREVILPLQVVSDQNLANIVPAPVKITSVPTP